MVSGFGRPAPSAGEGAVEELPETTSEKSGFDEPPETTSEKSGFLGSSAIVPPLTPSRKRSAARTAGSPDSIRAGVLASRTVLQEPRRTSLPLPRDLRLRAHRPAARPPASTAS